MKTGTCPGCQKTKQLVSSPLVSCAVYDYLRADQLHPIIVGGGEVRATTDQLQAELLCNDCERSTGSSRYTISFTDTPLDTDADGETFAARTNSDIDVQRISHFALGIFWKASVHPWPFGQISLGPYGEAIRTWLRGETGFPKKIALNVVLSRPAAAQIIMNPPYETTSTGCHTYLFHVPGVLFRLSVGKQIPTPEKTLCFYSSAERFVVVSDTVTKKSFTQTRRASRSRRKRNHSRKRSPSRRSCEGSPRD